MALNEGYENMKGNILAMDPLPPVNRAFHLVQQVEKQKQVAGEIQGMPESSVLLANRSNKNSWQKAETKEEKMKKKCEHCYMRGHLKEECFKLVGYPEWFNKPKGKGANKEAPGGNNKAKEKNVMNVSKQQSDTHFETPLERKQEQGETSNIKLEAGMINSIVQQVMKAMGEKQYTSNFAGNVLNINNQNHYNENGVTWIVDTGASDHMSGSKEIFQHMKCLKTPIKVGLPDGSIKTVRETGYVCLLPELVIKDVLYIPDFKHNLLSVSKLLKDEGLVLYVDSKGCHLQDPTSRGVIAVGIEH